MSRKPAAQAGSVVVRRRLPAPAEEVFSWWTEPALLARWMTPVGLARAVVDLRVGGAFQVVMSGAGVTLEHHGAYLEIEPPRRLVFTWVSPYTGSQPSVVTLSLEPDGPETELVLLHERLPEQAADSHRGGWGSMLQRLAQQLSEVSR